jgi:hypothetical protein
LDDVGFSISVLNYTDDLAFIEIYVT